MVHSTFHIPVCLGQYSSDLCLSLICDEVTWPFFLSIRRSQSQYREVQYTSVHQMRRLWGDSAHADYERELCEKLLAMSTISVHHKISPNRPVWFKFHLL